jgi:methyltransferase (TIGR00027 family)
MARGQLRPLGVKAHGERESPLRNVSDTARWAAYYRALETRRPDALFRDPLAARLAGERGDAIARSLPRGANQASAWVARTVLFDRLLLAAIAEGVDTVVVLAAGFDARPYRLKLPPTLRWYEVDLPPLIAEKEALLAGERPGCVLRRRGCDLADGPARRELFAEIGAEARRAVIVTEGLLIYLAPQDVAALAEDLAAVPAMQRWITDLVSPRLLQMLQRKFGKGLIAAEAPFRFAPEQGPDFFLPRWRMAESAGILQEAARLGRLRFPLTLIVWFAARRSSGRPRYWSAVLRLDRVRGT